MRRFLALFTVVIVLVCSPMPVLATDRLDKDADPVPVVSSGSFTCDTWIHTSMDSFTVSGGELTGADWSFSRGYVSYNLTGTFTPGENVALHVSATMGEMGYQMTHKGNELDFYVKYYDASGRELTDLAKGKTFEHSADATMADEISAEIPAYADKVELFGSFTTEWTTPYAAAAETVAVKVTLLSSSEPAPIPPTPVATPALESTPTTAAAISAGNRSRPGSAEILRNIEFWIKWEENAKKWTPEEIEAAMSAPQVVKFGSLTGETWVLRAWDEDIDQAIYADYDTPLYHGDLIITRRRSGAILSWSDMSSFVVSEDSCIRLDIKQEKLSKVEILAGTVWTNLKKLVKDGDLSYEMSQAVAGIKGTTFVCEERDGVSTLKVFEGSVELTSRATGKTIQVSGGEMVSTDSTGKGTLTMFDVEEELARWDPYVQQVTAEAMEEAALTQKDGARSPTVAVILAAFALMAGIAAIVFVASRNKRKAATAPTYGATVQAQEIQNPSFCSNCGSQLAKPSRFCSHCGHRLQ
ncbi:MAG: zinc-ribbon domain-containing protein [Anaerolineales bacterium]|nr:zinc-ribbon domain-containing protein [Anaerolineales bacterium]